MPPLLKFAVVFEAQEAIFTSDQVTLALKVAGTGVNRG